MNVRVDQPDGKRQQEAAWIEAFLAGDAHGFDLLVQHHKDRVFNLCYRFMGDFEEAEDCAQETFVKVYRSLKSFRFRSSFSTWLYRIAVNTCKNRLESSEYRHRKRMVPIEPGPGMDPEGVDCVEIMDPSPSPLALLTAKEREDLLGRAMDALPTGSRAVLILRDVEGLSYDEIAAVTGLRLGTVKSRLARARLQLREALEGVI